MSLLQLLRKRTFFHDIATVMTGTVLAQVISFLLMPLISRLYSPQDFGIFGSFISVSGIIGAGVTLQYQQALMLPKQDEDATNVFASSCLATVLFTILLMLATLTCAGPLLRLFGSQELQPVLWLLSVGVLMSGLNQSISGWCIRRKAFRDTSCSQIVRSLAACGAQSAVGTVSWGGSGLIGGFICGDILANLVLWRVTFQKDWQLFRSSVSWARIRSLAYEYYDFPVYCTPQNVLNAISWGIPVILLAHYFGATVAGYYAFGFRILMAPMNFVLNALRQVLFQKASEVNNHGNRIGPLFYKSTLGLVSVALLPSLVGFIFAPKLFALLFGSRWYIAGEYARWLIFWLAINFCNTPSVLFIRILRQQRYHLIFDLTVLLARVGTLIIGGHCLSAMYTILLFSVVGGVFNLGLIVWIWCLVGREDAAREVTLNKMTLCMENS